MTPTPFSKPHQTGCIIGEPNEVYHADPALSCSRLKVFANRPRLYKAQYVDRTYQPPRSAALDIGSALHDLVLLGRDHYNKHYAVAPKCNRRTKAGKAVWEEFYCDEGSTILKADDGEAVERMAKGIMDHPEAAAILEGGLPEVTWRTPQLKGLPIALQCRTDHLKEGVGFGYTVTDIKTVTSLEGFSKSIADYSYHMQAGFYLLTIAIVMGGNADLDSLFDYVDDWRFIAVEKTEPYEAAVFTLARHAIEQGAREALDCIKRLCICLNSSEWPMAYPEARLIDLPAWYYTREVA